MIKIYKYMRSIRMQAAFWKEVAFILSFIAAATAFIFYRSKICALFIASYGVYLFIHHFAVNYDIYRLRRKRLDSKLSPEDALKEYQADICMINSENYILRHIFTAVLILTVSGYVWLLSDAAMVLPISIVLLLIHIAAGTYAYIFFRTATAK
ncbi:MAG: hypothetical protein RR573_09075 [Oscillospiraceae bacterium]